MGELPLGESRMIHWPDLFYSARLKREWEVVIAFEVFEWAASEVIEANGDHLGHQYRAKGWVSCVDMTPDVDAAEVWMEGSIKWDGCADYTFPCENCYHACGLDDAKKIGTIWERLYAEGAKALGRDVLDC